MISSEISTAGPYELRSYQGSFVKMYFDATLYYSIKKVLILHFDHKVMRISVLIGCVNYY